MKLQGRVAIVTGGGRGLGSAIAFAMAREGAHIVTMGRSKEHIEKVADQIRDSGGEALSFQGDVSREGDVSDLVEETLKQFSTVDILVNNASIIGPARFLYDAEPEAWRKTIDINLNGVFLCSRAVVPIMVERQRGKIINISSGLGQMPFPRFCAYAVSKAAVIQITRSLAEELKEHHIQVNAIDPGVMDTAMQEKIRNLEAAVLGEKLHRRFLEYKEKGILKSPEEVAPLAVFLASSNANHLTAHFGTLNHFIHLGWQP